MADASGAMGAAIDFVGSTLSKLQSTADRYGAQLNSALTSIANVQVENVPEPTTLPALEPAAPVFNLGSPPSFSAPGPATTQSVPDVSIDDLLSALDVGDMDAIPDAPALIPLNLPDAPGFATIAAPERPAIDTSVEMPEAPTVTLPDMDALEQITLPAFEFPQLPDFDAKPPTLDIATPNAFINWSEPRYESEVLDELTATIRTLMAGGTGLPPPIEDALFARVRERDSAETARAVQEAVDTWAARDFSMPPGMLAKQANVAREQGRLRAAETNRDILVQAAQWEIENLRFAVQQGMALEQLTSNLFSNTVNRLFEAARFQAESQINLYNAQIGYFNAQNAAFQTTVTIYRTRLDAALSKLQAYKTAVEGQVAIGQINAQRVEVFKARLSAVQASVELFTAKMQGAKVRADVISSQFDAYKADVQAYAEQVSAEKTKFDAYEAQVRGETAKAGMLDAQARAYASTVQAIASKADIRVKGAQIKMEAARTKVQKYTADVERFRAEMSESLGRAQYSTQAFAAQVDAWKAQASANTAAAEVQSRFADMNVRTNIAFAEMQISAYQAQMQRAIQQANIALEAAKAVGQYSAQLAAGAMSAAHISASVSGTGSSTDTFSKTTSTGTSTNYNYSY